MACLLPSLSACKPQAEIQQWVSEPSKSSAYKATLIEKSYNDGESVMYEVRVEARPTSLARGWFFTQPIESGGMIRSVKPVLTWTSPTDLLAVVHTEALAGQTVRQLADTGRSSGSLTIQYIADQQ